MGIFLNQTNGIIFFDIDDTLCNTSEFFKAAVIKSLEILLEEQPELNVSINSLFDAYINIYNKDKNAQNHYSILLKYLGFKKERLNQLEKILVQSRHNFKFEKYKNFAYIDSIDLIKRLSKQNYTLGIISDGIEKKQLEKLNLLGILNYFDKNLIFITESKNPFKKNFIGYKKIYQKIKSKYKSSNLWMIGDREDRDILPAKENNFKTIRILRGKYLQSHQISQALISSDNLYQIPTNSFFILNEIENKLNFFKNKSNFNKIQQYSSELLNIFEKNDYKNFQILLNKNILEISPFLDDSSNEIKTYFLTLQGIKKQIELFNF